MLVDGAPDDEDLRVRYIQRTLEDGGVNDVKEALSRDMKTALSRCPEVAVRYLLNLNGSPEIFSAGDLLLLGKWCEAHDIAENALSLYGLIEQNHSASPELELALYRASAVHWHRQQNGKLAVEKINKLLSAFPHGSLTLDAEDLRDDIIKQSGGAQAA
jgi:hypothetical protein